MLTINTKMRVYQACVLSTLLYGSETWTLYTHQEHRLRAFHMRCLRKILGIRWQDHIPNKTVLEKAGIPTMYSLLSQRRLRWLGQVARMDDGRIPKDLLYGELATGSRPVGRPALRFKDVCKRDMKNCDIDPSTWEAAAADRSTWRATIKTGTQIADQKKVKQWEERRDQRQQRSEPTALPSQDVVFICSKCDRNCHSRIGLFSHSRRCSQQAE